MLENCSYNDIRKFIGCDQCNKKTDNERNEVFECPWCHKKESIAKPRLVHIFICTSLSIENSHIQFLLLSSIRLALTFDAHDSTGSIQLTAFNDTIAELFEKTIDELYSLATYVREKSLKSNLAKFVTLIISILTTISLSSLNRNILNLIKTLLNPYEWNRLRYSWVQLLLYPKV